MPTVQLKRYKILPGQMEAFLAWWEKIAEVREQYGFRVLFAFVDDSADEFIWAISHHGDFDEADVTYHASPERAKVGKPSYLAVRPPYQEIVRVARPTVPLS